MNVSRETIKNGQLVTLTVTGCTADGAGVGRVDGQVVFVPGTIPGETVRARIVNVGKTAAHGVVTELVTASPHRIAPDCPYYEKCGGCDFRHMDYETELHIKQQRVLDALTRIGGQEIADLPITGAAETDGYRNKVQYPVTQRKNTPIAGFFRERTHEIVSVETCRIQPACADRIRAAILQWMREYGICGYDEKTRTGVVRHIYLREGRVSGEILVCPVVNCKRLAHTKELVSLLTAAEPNIESIVLSYNEKAGNTVLGDRFETIYGKDAIEDTLCGLRFRLSPRSFYQVNHDQAERLYEKAVEKAGLDETKTALDLYCGAGTITLCLARRAKKVYGVEIVDAAIRDARENAARNGVENAEFFCADAGQAAQRFAAEGIKPDVIVVDPPRKGLSADTVGAMLQMSPERIVYVSCDPATLARDVKLLCAGGYRMTSAEAFDLFPRCAHVETVVLMSRKELPL